MATKRQSAASGDDRGRAHNEQTLQKVRHELESTKEELAEARRQIQELNAALREVTPLRRHLVKHAKSRFVQVDRKIVGKLSYDRSFSPVSSESLAASGATTVEDALTAATEYDQKNFTRFSQPRYDSPLLPRYIHARNVGHRMVRKLAKKVVKG